MIPTRSVDEQPRQTGIDFYESYAFVFRSRDWHLNLVLGFVCFLIAQFFSILGLVAVVAYWGYTFQIAESRIKFPGSIYPTFEFNRLGGYLHRACWPFLLTLPLWLAWSAQWVIWEMLIIFSSLLIFEPDQLDETRAAISLGIPSAILLAIFACSILWMVAIPMTFRAAMTRSFREAFRFRWLAGFIRRTWLELLLSFVFVLCTSWMISSIGLMAACMGLFAAQAWALLATSHLSWQLYDLYLLRGGEEIEMHAEPLPFVPPPFAPQWYPGAGFPQHTPGQYADAPHDSGTTFDDPGEDDFPTGEIVDQ